MLRPPSSLVPDSRFLIASLKISCKSRAPGNTAHDGATPGRPVALSSSSSSSASCSLRNHRHPVWGPRDVQLHSRAGPCTSAVRLGDAETAADRGHLETEAAEVNEEGRTVSGGEDGGGGLSVGVGSPNLPVQLRMYRMSMGDQAFFLLSFIACTTSIAFTSLVIAAVPTLFAMKRAATSLAKLADTAREELPSTMAAIRLSGMEISDLTLELSDLSQEIADGVSKSAQAVQAAEAGIRQIGDLARHRTVSMIQERASLPYVSLQPVVAGAARKTSHVVGQARKTFMNIISRADYNLEDEGNGSDRDTAEKLTG